MTAPATPGKWAGRPVTTARAYWAPRLPLPCYLCGRPVTSTMKWVVEHVIPRALGGHATHRSNQWVSHRACSDRSGGQAGAPRTNATKPTVRARRDTNATRRIRGV